MQATQIMIHRKSVRDAYGFDNKIDNSNEPVEEQSE